jgi:cyclophilin family peptidyl-prolyl cis-trans isomerase
MYRTCLGVGAALALLLGTVGCSSDAFRDRSKPPSVATTNYYRIQTGYGDMIVRLSDITPKHRDNFKALVAEGAYDGTTFHRVIDGFVIQGGDLLSTDDDLTNDGTGALDYTVPFEPNETQTHRRGVLAAVPAAAGMSNQSNATQFYIVVGAEAAQLDGTATIFGEVVRGMSTADVIARQPTRRKLQQPAPQWLTDQPPQPVRMVIRPAPEAEAALRR